MISVNNLSVEFGVKPLFSGATFVVNDKERVALVGRNGVGKSTLLKILAGLQRPTAGEAILPAGQTVGYLPQTMHLEDGRTVREEAALAFSETDALARRVDKLGAQLAERQDYESQEYIALCDLLARETERLHLMGSAGRMAELERTLTGLGFGREELNRPTAELSGGWRMRVELAKLLLRRPDVLLLDEPTNHLDIWSIQWLERFLRQSPAAVIVVSHDRAFINHVTTRTLEINCGRIIDYRVGYDEYVQLRAERRESQLRAWENQQKEIADTKAFIERFRYKPAKAVQVQSRIKMLEKIVPIEIDEVDRSSLRLKFPPCSRSGDFPLVIDGLSKAYGTHQVLHDVALSLRRGEKVAFVGRNGEGKSTLVKCIMGEIPFEGTLKLGHNVETGYYAQNQAMLLNENLTVYDTVDHAARGEVRLRLRDILGAFMFGGEAGDKPVHVLSGGERSRLAMIQLLLQPVNFLILDEPTNHLDMRTKDVLKEAVRSFEGTAIIVSHDRDFLDGLVEKVYEFGGGSVREYIGGIYDFLQARDISELGELENAGGHPKAESLAKSTETGTGALAYEQQKELRRREQKLKRQVEDSERRVGELEAAIKILEAQMMTPEGAQDGSLADKHGRLNHQLKEAMEEWTQASEELEKLDK